MDWLFDNFGKLIPVIIAILYMIGSAKSRSKDEEEVDPQAAERARKIQEEIRKKILERQRGSRPQVPTHERHPSKPVVSAPPLREKTARGDHWHPAQERNARDTVETPKRAQSVEDWQEDEWGGFNTPASIYKQQEQEIEEKMRKARELRERISSVGQTRPMTSAATRERAMGSGSLRSLIESDLNDRSAIRKAILLKEILDTPVGLR